MTSDAQNPARRSPKHLVRLGALLALLSGCDGGTTTVELSVPSPYLDVGQQVQIGAVVRGSQGVLQPRAGVRWSSSDPGVASVAGGVVTGRAAGTVTIRAAAGGASETVTLEVERPVARVEVRPVPDTLLLTRGRSVRLLVQAYDAAGNPVAHSYSVTSSDSSVLAAAGTEITGRTLGVVVVTVRAGLRSTNVPVRVVSGERYTARCIGEIRRSGDSMGGINNRGWVVGHSRAGRALLWRDGETLDLHPPGYSTSRGVVVNDSGVVVIEAERSSSEERYIGLWYRGTHRPVDLPATTPTGLAIRSPVVMDINGRGQVVGHADAYHAESRRSFSAAFLWEGGRTTWLADFVSLPSAVAINDQGVVLVNDTTRGYLWRDGRLTPLAGVPPTRWQSVMDINNRGQVLGWMGEPGGSPTVFVADGTSPVELLRGVGSWAENRWAREWMINDHGEIVQDWLIRDGKVLDLDLLVEPRHWNLARVRGINDWGQIIVHGTRGAGDESCLLLLTPGS